MLLRLFHFAANGSGRDGCFRNIRWAVKCLLGYLSCSRQLLRFAGFEHGQPESPS